MATLLTDYICQISCSPLSPPSPHLFFSPLPSLPLLSPPQPILTPVLPNPLLLPLSLIHFPFSPASFSFPPSSSLSSIPSSPCLLFLGKPLLSYFKYSAILVLRSDLISEYAYFHVQVVTIEAHFCACILLS